MSIESVRKEFGHSVWICLVSLFILMILAISVYSQWDNIKETFFNVTLFNICHVAITVILGFYIANTLNLRVSRNIKKREICVVMLDRLEGCINNAYRLGCNYLEEHETEPAIKKKKELIILLELRIIANRITFIQNEFDNSDSAASNNLESNCLKFKESITGANFRSDIIEYPPDNVIFHCTDTYQKMIDNIDMIKLGLLQY